MKFCPIHLRSFFRTANGLLNLGFSCSFLGLGFGRKFNVLKLLLGFVFFTNFQIIL